MKKKRGLYIVFAIILLILVLALFSFYYMKTQKITGNAVTSSQVGNLSASIQTYIACTWSDEAMNVGFGANLDPGTDNINATKNYNLTGGGTAYNVTASTLSNVNVDITIKGANLISGANTIAVGNVSWASNNSQANGTNMISGSSVALQTDFDSGNKVGAGLIKGQTAHFRFWLDVPAAQVAGDYVGNFTQQCAQAS